MGRRRKSNFSDSGSLELLLDTITNAFGGIVFLAILIVVLLETTTDDVGAESGYDQLDVVERRLKIQDLEAEKDRLEVERKFSDKVVAELADPELVATIAELAELKGKRDKKEQQKSTVVDKINALQKNTKSIQQELSQLDADLLNASRAVGELGNNLKSERQRRTVNARFPEERSTSKNAFNLTLRYGRWYVDLLPSSRPNLEDFAVLDEGGEYLTVTPKPYRGKPIVEGDRLSNSFLQYLKQRNPQQDYISVSIWDDSFGEFQLLRDYLVSQGLEYRLIVLTDGDFVVYGAGVDALVQ